MNTVVSEFPDYLLVNYWNTDIDPTLGKTKGGLVSIDPNLKNFGRTSKPYWSQTIIPPDRQLIQKLLGGELLVDTDNTTPTRAEFVDGSDEWRIAALRMVTDSREKWLKSPFCQAPATAEVYSQYIQTYLRQFTQATSHIPLEEKLKAYPHCLLEPCSVEILVGRDAIAFSFSAPERPEKTACMIDTDHILDELLLPHPKGMDYTIHAPNSSLRISSGDFYLINDYNGFLFNTPFCNPDTVVMNKGLHAFFINKDYRRLYPKGNIARRFFPLIEVFGDISERNFTQQKAIDRALKFAEQRAIDRWTNGHCSNFQELTEKVTTLRDIMETEEESERSIEKFFDENPWMLERGFGIRKYHSQVHIPKEIASERADRDYIPDKFLERHDGYADVLDMKLPYSRVVLKNKDWPYFSSCMSKYEGQVLKYCEIANEPDVRRFLLDRGIQVLFPRAILLVGRRPEGNLLEEFSVKNRCQAYTVDRLCFSPECPNHTLHPMNG